MPSHQSGRGNVSPSAVPPVRIITLDANQSVTVRFLSYNPLGAFTHWDRRFTVLCKGEDCPAALHKSQWLWKSWQCVERWVEQAKLWYPAVLEVTENLELDFRNHAARGQLWEVSRPMRKKGKRNSIQGVFLEERDATGFPAPFNVQVVLRTVFHVDHVALDRPNPMPPRLVVEPSRDAGPRGQEQEDVSTETERKPIVPITERFRQHIANRNGQGS